jgi:AcrR family transcriptional regulator
MVSRILDAAMTVFGDQGFQATTLKDIAAGAAISTGSIYTYFPDKQSLFQAAALYGWERFSAELEDIEAAGLDMEERLARLLGSGFAALDKALPLLRGMLFDATRQNLVQPGLERVIAAIDKLVAPAEGGRARGAGFTDEKRHTLIRIFVTGILFSAALGEARSSSAALDRLRGTMVAFIELMEGAWNKEMQG